MTSTLKQTQGAHQPIFCMPLGFIMVEDSFYPFYTPIPGLEHLTSHLVESIPSYNLPSEVHTLPSEVHTLPSNVHTLPSNVHTLPSNVQNLLPEICVPEHPIPEEVRPDNSKSSSPKYIALETEDHRSYKRKRTTTVVSNDNFNITPAAPLLENQSFESATEPDDTMLKQFSLPSQDPSASHIQARELSNMYGHNSLPYSYNHQGH
jgi:hypothetical protein